MHLQYVCFFDCHVDVDACIYSTCAFLIVMFNLMYAFTVLVFFDCHVDVDNVQHRELVHFYGYSARAPNPHRP